MSIREWMRQNDKLMAKLFKWLMVMTIPLLSTTLTSCSDSEDEPSQDSSKEMYTFSQTQTFSKKWMVESITENGNVRYAFEYDANNQPVSASIRSNNIQYSYEGSTCTFTKDGDKYKGYFNGNKLMKAEWDEYTITNVTYEGDHLVKGSNGYRLTWDSNGNITNYSDQGMSFTYTDILNKTNIDFNMIVASLLADCWCDDGSEFFTIFGWTGARTTNLISTRQDRDGYHYDFSYIVDELGRPIEIDVVEYTDRGNRYDDKYIITYIEP